MQYILNKTHSVQLPPILLSELKSAANDKQHQTVIKKIRWHHDDIMDILGYPAISLKNAPNSLDVWHFLSLKSGDASGPNKAITRRLRARHNAFRFLKQRSCLKSPRFLGAVVTALWGIIPNISTSKHSRKASMFYTKKQRCYDGMLLFSPVFDTVFCCLTVSWGPFDAD